MNELLLEIKNKVSAALKENNYNDDVVINFCNKLELGEFQYNGMMKLSKIYDEVPRDMAQKVVNVLSKDKFFSKVEVAGPGFINIVVNDDEIIKFINKSINDVKLLVPKINPCKIIIDYGGANAAKALHVGHMRSANIGEGLNRLARIFGNEVISDVHLGDLGRQSGMLISEIKKRNPELCFFDKDYKGEYPKIDITSKMLGEYYSIASMSAKEDEKRMEEVREITSLVESGYPPYLNLWKQIVEVSSRDIKNTYLLLNTKFDLWEGEMDSIKYTDKVLEYVKDYMYPSEGAMVVDVKEEGDKLDIPPMIIINRNGATNYETRELGTLYSRMERFNPDEIWYVVDNRQSLHFIQSFRVARKCGMVNDKTKLLHLGFGTINGKDGKPFKTRDGGVMQLNDLIDMIKEEITKKVSDRVTDELKEDTISKLTIATLKYADLVSFRSTDYIFDVEKFSSFEGKTGPYVLYTEVRIKSLLDKNNLDKYNIEIITDKELPIYLKLLEVSNVLYKSYEEKSLNYICDYLYELCSLYNKFYGECNITNETDLKLKNSWLSLSKYVYDINKFLLDILAIDIPSRM